MGPWGRRAVETARWVSSRMGRKASLPKLGEEWHVKRQLQVEDQKDTFEQNWFSDFHRFVGVCWEVGSTPCDFIQHSLHAKGVSTGKGHTCIVPLGWGGGTSRLQQQVFFFNSLRKRESHKRCGLISGTEGMLEGLWSNTSYLKGMLEDSLKSKGKKKHFFF